jgi:dipeptidase E
MSLVLYSGGHYKDNVPLNRICIESTGKRHPKITYIPACSDWGLEDFREFVEAFDAIRRCHYVYFPIDFPFTQEMKERAFESDIIFMSGGNTFYFLNKLRQNKLLSDLKKFHKSGKTLAGLSAGAILLTPHIQTASYPSFDCDDNFVGLRNFSALKLVPAEFFPHYTHSPRYKKALLQASQKSSYPLFGVPDGSGLIYSDEELRILGSAYLFHKGHLISFARNKKTPRASKTPLLRRLSQIDLKLDL